MTSVSRNRLLLYWKLYNCALQIAEGNERVPGNIATDQNKPGTSKNANPTCVAAQRNGPASRGSKNTNTDHKRAHSRRERAKHSETFDNTICRKDREDYAQEEWYITCEAADTIQDTEAKECPSRIIRPFGKTDYR